ncbi:MAG: AI-2E family transporter [Lachnospiraceae bacterium]|nr:AI-2E family transporter [Lachnospiraceae bacterium]
MKVEWKNCFRVGISVFLVFLGIYYWNSVTKWAWLIVGAAAPLLIGVIIAYVLNILMSFYERLWFPGARSKAVKKSRRIICLVLAIVTLLGIAAAVIGLVLPELVASVQLLIQLVIDWLPNTLEDLSHNQSLAELIPVEVWNTLETINWQELINKAVQAVTNGIGGAVGTVAGVITSVFSTIVTVLVAIIFALYLLIGKDRLMNQGNRIMNAYLRPDVNKKTRHILDVLNDCFHRYVVGQCLEAVILGSLCMIGMFIFRFPYATMIGTLVGFTALIPIAGAYIGAVVGAFMILTVSPLQAVLFVVYLTILQQLEGNLIYPRVVGSSLGLPGIWVLAAVTIGGGLFGILGMLIGVPLAAALYRLLREDVNRREGKNGGPDTHHRRNRHKANRGPENSVVIAQKPMKQEKPQIKAEAEKQNQTKQNQTKQQEKQNQAKQNQTKQQEKPQPKQNQLQARPAVQELSGNVSEDADKPVARKRKRRRKKKSTTGISGQNMI